jgi:hypothetical protein
VRSNEEYSLGLGVHILRVLRIYCATNDVVTSFQLLYDRKMANAMIQCLTDRLVGGAPRVWSGSTSVEDWTGALNIHTKAKVE